MALSEISREADAINTYKSAYLVDPDYPFVLGNIVVDKLKHGDWHKIENDTKEILSKIQNKKQVADPLTASYIFDSPLLLFEAAKIWVNFKDSKKKKTI